MKWLKRLRRRWQRFKYGCWWDGEWIVHPEHGRYKAVVPYVPGTTLYPWQTVRARFVINSCGEAFPTPEGER